MRVTLSKLNEVSGRPGLNRLKKLLYVSKETGTLFFIENIFQLSPEQPFQIYYAYRSSNQSFVNAFPIEVPSFRSFNNPDTKLNILKHHFETYYKRKNTNPKLFLSYETDHPFIGRKYVWFFRQLNDFEMHVIN